MIAVKKAAVLGAGTMGAQIAAHLANAGIPTFFSTLFRAMTPGGNADRQGRSPGSQRIARAGFEAARKAKPAAFFTSDLAALVSGRKFRRRSRQAQRLRSDHRSSRRESSRSNAASTRKSSSIAGPGSIIASNTSGIPLQPTRRRTLGRFSRALSRHALLQSAALHAPGRDHSHRMDQTGSLLFDVRLSR